MIQIHNLSGGYQGKNIVHSVNFRLKSGDICFLLGPNGCGKTTLLRIILGLIPASAGQIRIDNQPICNFSVKELSRKIAYIPQYHQSVFPYTALDMVLMGRAGSLSFLSTPKKKDKEAAFEALRSLNIENLSNKNYMILSGGQKQMVLIARALCQSATILVMDEPASGLDYAKQQLLLQVLQTLQSKHYTIVMSTHSPDHPLALGGKALLLSKGSVAAFGNSEEVLTPRLLEEVYGIEMDVLSFYDRYGMKRLVALPVNKISELKKAPLNP